MSGPIKVAVAGHRGKVGSVLAAAFQSDPDIDYVGGVSRGDDLATFLHAPVGRLNQALIGNRVFPGG